jgi:hypothetical protein
LLYVRHFGGRPSSPLMLVRTWRCPVLPVSLSRPTGLRRTLGSNRRVPGATLESKLLQPRIGFVERCPQKLRPYLYLARLDKPIGTLLLFYPCGSSRSTRLLQAHIQASLVNYDGGARSRRSVAHPCLLYHSVRNRCIHNERRRMYHKRSLG